MNLNDIGLKTAEYSYSKMKEDFDSIKKNYPQKFPKYFYGKFTIKMAENDKNLLSKDKNTLHHLVLSENAKKSPKLIDDIKALILDINVYFAKFRNTQDL